MKIFRIFTIKLYLNIGSHFTGSSEDLRKEYDVEFFRFGISGEWNQHSEERDASQYIPALSSTLIYLVTKKWYKR